SSIAPLVDSPPAKQMRKNEDRPATRKSPPSSSSQAFSTDAASGETDDLVDSSIALPHESSSVNQMLVDEDHLSSSGSIDSYSDLANRPSWGTLPASSRPFINYLCFHLRTDEDCADLANLAKVQYRYSNVKG
ncbi:hypothetical protein PMAYCL1PPCAC_27461, partial [Pristionchus mayeri]